MLNNYPVSILITDRDSIRLGRIVFFDLCYQAGIEDNFRKWVKKIGKHNITFYVPSTVWNNVTHTLIILKSRGLKL